MANTTIPFVPVPFLVEGDGSTLTASYTLSFTPTIVVLVSATKISPLGAIYGAIDVSANISSVTLAGNVLTFHFVAGFTGNYTITVDFDQPLAGGGGAGTGQLVNQGAQGTIAASWYSELTDGTNIIGVVAHPLYVQGTLAISNFPSPVIVVGSAASGSPASGNPVQVGAVYGGVLPELTVGEAVALQSNAFGSLSVDGTGEAPTYRGCQSAFTPLSDPTVPFFVMQGSATKTIKIRHVKITWACTTGNAAPNLIRIRRYTAISGGTPNAITPVPLDVNNPAATATISQYSVLPTVATPYNAGRFHRSTCSGSRTPQAWSDLSPFSWTLELIIVRHSSCEALPILSASKSRR